MNIAGRLGLSGRTRFVRALATEAGPRGVQTSEKLVTQFLSSPASTESLRSALKECANIEAAYKASLRADYHEVIDQSRSESANKLLDQVLAKYESEKVAKITNQTLLEYFTNAHPPSTTSALKVLTAFAKNGPKNFVPELIAMIPFRRAVYAADFRGALDVMAHTCGSKSNYRHKMTQKLYKMAGAWSLVTTGALTGVYSSLMSGYVGEWTPGTAAMICGMFGVYIAAVSLYGSMTLAGSKSGLGLVLEWIPGTSPLYRYYHTEQLKMATFVTDLNRSLPENLGECSPQLLMDLQSLQLRPVESSTDANLKEYWARGGDGFDWAEPDQDPSELLWTEHMEATKQKRIGSAYSRKDSEGKLLSWMGEVQKEKEGRSIPHASLLGVDELRNQLNSPSGMLSFEEELRNDMLRLKNSKNLAIEGENENNSEEKDIKQPKI